MKFEKTINFIFLFLFSVTMLKDLKANLKNLSNIVPVAIIGSGPAGLTSGLYSGRFGYYTVIFEGPLPGGQLMKAAWIENWPGLEKTQGKTAINDLKKQTKKFGAKIVNKTIESVDFYEYPFKLQTNDGQVINALSVIVASGATPRKLGIPGENEYWSKGIQECAICDAPLFKEKSVLIVGGDNDPSIEQALLLQPYAKKIIFIVQDSKITASNYMEKKLKSIPQVKILYNTKVLSFDGDGKHLKKATIFNKKQNKSKEIKVSGAFICIGQEANTKFLDNQIDLNSSGCIKVNKNQETNINGIFAAGNVSDCIYRQATVACSAGCKAALQARNFLISKNINFNNIKNNFYLYGQEQNSIDKTPFVEINDHNSFNEYIANSKKPVFVFLFNPSCPHCHAMMPIVDSIFKYNSNINLVKVDITKANDIAQKFNISGVPTFIVIKNSKVIGKFIGQMSKVEFEEKLNKLIK